MSRGKIKPGFVLAIPIQGLFFSGTVIHVSKYFKGAMFIELTGPYSDENMLYTGGPKVVLGEYTTSSIRVLNKFGWKIVGERTVSETDLDKCVFVVGNEVWRADTPLRKATPEDLKGIPLMGGAGVQFIINKLTKKVQSMRKD